MKRLFTLSSLLLLGVLQAACSGDDRGTDPCRAYTYRDTSSLSGDGGFAVCTSQLPMCPSLTLDAIDAALLNVEVQTALSQHHVYGYSDGTEA